MPDRYDPKFPARSTGDRTPLEEPKAARGGKSPKPDDPLVELARIVSGRSPLEGSASRPERSTAPSSSEPTSSKGQPLPSEADLARDLEAELLNELQASFSTIPEIVGRPAQPPRASPSAPRQQTPQPAREAPPTPQGFAEEPPAQPQATQRPSAAETGRQTPAAQPRPEIRPPQGAQKRESLASRIARAAQGGEKQPSEASPAEAPAAPRPPAQQPSPANTFRPANADQRPDTGVAQFRPTIAPNPPRAEPPAQAPVPRQAVTRWDPPSGQVPSQTQAPFDVSRFAPQQGDGFAPEPDEFQGEEAFFEELPFAATEEAYFDEMPENENYETVPGYGDPDLVPYPGEDLAEPRRSRRGPLAIAALFTIAVIGGAAVIMLRSGGADDTPPIITADASPTKVAPDDTGAGDSEGQAKLIYDRVDPGSEVADSQLVVPDGGPIADIPPIPGESNGDVSRVILGGGPGFDSEGGESDPSAPMDLSEGMGTTVASSSQPTVPIGPKKVRTVVVRPDGTIVSSEATSAEESVGTINEPPPPSETPPAPDADANPLLSENFAAEVIGGQPAGAFQEDTDSASVPDIASPAPAPRTAAPQSPTVVATTGSTSGPVDLTPGTSSSGTTSSSAGLGGDFLVQVSSQRSEAIALETFRELQRRYPGILGDRQPDIQRADLGERGVYYRVRVGYQTREEAVRMCEDLKAAGGDCLLASR